MKRRLNGNLKSTATVLLLGATVVMFTASQVVAAPLGTIANSSATAIGGNIITTGTCQSANSGPPGTAATQTAIPGTGGIVNLTTGCTAAGGTTQSGALLAAQTVIQTGGAVANADGSGSSVACAGVTGPGGGLVSVGPSNPCGADPTVINNGTGAGVTVLGSLVSATAAYASCGLPNTAGHLPATPTVVGLALAGGTLLGALNGLGLGTLAGLPTDLNPAPSVGGSVSNISLGTTPLLTLTLNNVSTTSTAAGQLGPVSATALDLKVLPGGLTAINGIPVLGPALLGLLGLSGGALTSALANGLQVTIGQVSCGANAAKAVVVNALPVKALPIAAGVLLLAGGAAYLGRRQLFSAFRG